MGITLNCAIKRPILKDFNKVLKVVITGDNHVGKVECEVGKGG